MGEEPTGGTGGEGKSWEGEEECAKNAKSLGKAAGSLAEQGSTRLAEWEKAGKGPHPSLSATRGGCHQKAHRSWPAVVPDVYYGKDGGSTFTYV